MIVEGKLQENFVVVYGLTAETEKRIKYGLFVVTSTNFIISAYVFDELIYAHVSRGKYTYNALAAYLGSVYVCVDV